MNNKKAMELPVNVVVMVIIGIIIFSMGLALFSRVLGAGDDKVDLAITMVKGGIESLECEGDEWICSPSVSMKDGDTKDFKIYVANRGELDSKFEVDLPNLVEVSGGFGIKKDCGEIIVIYPKDIKSNIFSGEGAEVPYQVKANNIKSRPCSFVTTAVLDDSDDKNFEDAENKKAAMIIEVK